jgi:hypothetical protein
MRKHTVSQGMTISTIRATFPEEWVAAEVTAVDKADVPVAGIVLTHSPEKTRVYQAVQTYRGQYPAVRLFIFFTGDPIPADVEVAFACH